MALNNLDEAKPVLSDHGDSLDDQDDTGSDGAGRQLRHVLIPSELVSVEFNCSGGEPVVMQADLINVSDGGCCLVLPRRLDLPSGAVGILHRSSERGRAITTITFVVRWAQELGEMMQIGVQYSEAGDNL